MIESRTRTLTLLIVMIICSCSTAPKPSEPATPLAAHLVTSEGKPVAGAPEPEVVQLKKIETIDGEKHVTVDCLDLLQLRSEEHTSELQSLAYLVCRLL